MAFLPFRKEGQLSLSELQDQMNMLFNRMWHAGVSAGPFDGQDWAPSLDVYDTPARYVITAEVPGLRVEDIEVTYSGNSVTLSGEKVSESAEELGRGCLCSERRYGKFSRTVTLPEAILADKISATCRQGVLEVVLPKEEQAQPTSIKIDVTE
jgi:HSP20 family protein